MTERICDFLPVIYDLPMWIIRSEIGRGKAEGGAAEKIILPEVVSNRGVDRDLGLGHSCGKGR